MRRIVWMLIVLGALLAGLWSCSGSEDSNCGNSDDCPADQICSEGVCRSPSGAVCQDDLDCPGGYRCQAQQCERIETNIDAGNNSTTTNSNTSTPDMGGNNANNANNTSNDNINPQVIAFTPADGAGDVALDTAVTIEFDEALRVASINPGSVPLKDGSNSDVTITTTYDEASFTATITPTSDLREATPYTIVATSNVFDEAGNRLIETSSRFYTSFEEPAHHTAVAQKYAPVIYQDIRDTSATEVVGDIPTTVDFDGNASVADNLESARTPGANVPARAYYSVIESESHFFIHYILYYAWRYSDSAFPHDFTGTVVVVEKSTDEVVLVEGAALRSDEIAIGFGISGRGVNFGGGIGSNTSYTNLGAGELVDGDRFPLYVTPGTHEACAWPLDGSFSPISICLHDAGEGTGAEVVRMTPGAAQSYGDAMDSDGDMIPEMTYELVSLVGTLWTRRSDVGLERYWEANTLYRPAGSRPDSAESSDTPLLLPTRLTPPRDEEGNTIDGFGRTPFQWFEQSSTQNAGQWFIDPAYQLAVRYSFGDPYAQDYCYNPFLAIDRLDAQDAPDCATPGN